MKSREKKSICGNVEGKDSFREGIPFKRMTGSCRPMRIGAVWLLPVLFLFASNLCAHAQVTLEGVAIISGLWGSDITDHLSITDKVTWVSASFENNFSYDVEVTYSVTLDGNTIASGTADVWAESYSITYKQVSPAQSLTAGSHVLSLISGSAHYDRNFTVSTSVNHQPTNILLSATNVAENLPVGTKVGHFTAQDPDAGSTFAYSLVAGSGSTDNGSFTISGSNLLTAAVFNYEVKSNFSIRVQAMDQGGLSTQKVFAIRVTDVDETPSFEPPAMNGDGSLVLRWSSVANHQYSVMYSTNLMKGFEVWQSNIVGYPPMNSYTVSLQNCERRFWVVGTQP